MKPGDHPELFRFPAPEGRSRESTIVLDRSGRFWHDGELVTHAGMQSAFATWIRRHPDDGRFILSNEYDWTYFTVEDTAFFVRAIDLRDGVPWVTLLDGSEEPLDLASVAIGQGGDALYVRVKDGEFEAKLLPSAQSALVDVIVEDADGNPVVQVLGRTCPIGRR